MKPNHPGRIAVALSLLTFLLAGCDSTGGGQTTRKEKDLLAGGTTQNDIDLIRDTARLYWDKSEFPRAARQYERVLELVDEDPEATLGLGMCYAQMGDSDPALFVKGRELLQNYNDQMAAPGDARGLLGLGILLFRHGTFSSSSVDTSTAQRIEMEDRLRENAERLLSSSSASNKRRLAKENEAIHAEIAKIDARIIEFEKDRDRLLADAVRYQTLALETDPLNVLPYKLRAETNALRGPRYFDQAIEDLDTYMDLTVTRARERFQQILATGKDEDGNEVPEAAVLSTMDRLDRTEAVLLQMRASLLRRVDRHEEAIETLQRVLHLQPERASAYAEIASALEEEGEYEDAISYLEQYIEALPVSAIEAKTQARLRIQSLQARTGASDSE